MIQEGIGEVAPKPISVRLTRADLLAIHETSAQRAGYRQYGASASRWKQGLLGGTDIPGIAYLSGTVAAIFIGSVGEFAFVSVCQTRGIRGVAMDTALRQAGDGGIDVALANLGIQVKTRKGGQGTSAEGVSLVRCVSSGGRTIPCTAAGFVFAEYAIESREVLLLGWLPTSQLVQRPKRPARKGTHLNYEVRDTELSPVSSIVAIGREYQNDLD